MRFFHQEKIFEECPNDHWNTIVLIENSTKFHQKNQFKGETLKAQGLVGFKIPGDRPENK